MTASYWENVQNYLGEAKSHTETQMEEPANIAVIDQAVTGSRNNLKENFGLDLDNEREMYAFIVGVLVSYRFPVAKAIQDCQHQLCFNAFMHHHGMAHGDIGLLVTSIIKDLGVEVAVPEEEG